MQNFCFELHFASRLVAFFTKTQNDKVLVIFIKFFRIDLIFVILSVAKYP